MKPSDLKPHVDSSVDYREYVEMVCRNYSGDLYTALQLADALEAAMDAAVMNTYDDKPCVELQQWLKKISELRGVK